MTELQGGLHTKQSCLIQLLLHLHNSYRLVGDPWYFWIVCGDLREMIIADGFCMMMGDFGCELIQHMVRRKCRAGRGTPRPYDDACQDCGQSDPTGHMTQTKTITTN